jgi:SAM-dependent methyltransferase
VEASAQYSLIEPKLQGLILLLQLLQRVFRRICEIPARGLPRFHSARVGDGADGIVWLTNPRSRNFARGVRYQGCDPVACEELIRSLDIRYEDWHFVDVGCGKGRALMIAKKFPFQRVIGVEYSPKLVTAARAVTGAMVFCCDAADYKFPEVPLVVFMYHPFDKSVLEKVLANLHGEVILVYLGVGREWPGENPRFKEVRRTKNAVIYRALAANGESHVCDLRSKKSD